MPKRKVTRVHLLTDEAYQRLKQRTANVDTLRDTATSQDPHTPPAAQPEDSRTPEPVEPQDTHTALPQAPTNTRKRKYDEATDGTEPKKRKYDETEVLDNFTTRYRKSAERTLHDIRKLIPDLSWDSDYLIHAPNTPLHGLSLLRVLHVASTPFTRPSLPTQACEYLKTNDINCRNHLLQDRDTPDVPGWVCKYY